MFIFNGERYPRYLHQEEGFEVLEVLIPEPTGDYFLAEIDSSGGYKFKDFVAANKVAISHNKSLERKN